MSNLRITTRVFIGFFVLISVVVLITTSLWWIGHKADTAVQTLSSTARTALNITTVNNTLQTMHRLAATFFYTADTDYINRVHAQAAKARSNLNELIQSTPTVAKKKQFLQMQNQIDSYLESFERRTSFMRAQTDLLTHSINPTALILIQKLDTLHNEIERKGNVYESEDLIESLNFFIRAHLAKADYLIQRNSDPHTTVLPLFDKAVRRFSNLNSYLEKIGKSDEYRRITSLFNTYRSSFVRVAELVFYDQNVIRPEMQERRAILEKLTETARLADIKHFTTQSQSIHSMIDKNRHIAAAFAAVMILLALGWSVLIVYGISVPLHHIVEAIQNLSYRNRHVTVPYRDHHDEIGKVANALAMLQEMLERNETLETEQRQSIEKKAERGAYLAKLLDTFDHDVRTLVSSVSGAADNLNTTAESMASIARQTGRQAVVVAQSSEGISMNAHCAVTASERLDDTFCRVSHNVCHASAFSYSTVQRIRDSICVVTDLKLAATEVRAISCTIAEISRQISLLSLNTSLELERSEDTDRGPLEGITHALKDLSTQANQATEDIRLRVGDIYSVMDGAASSLQTIANLVDETAQAALDATQSIEEQSAVVHDISRNLMRMARSTASITTTINGVSHSAAIADTESDRVLAATHALHHDADKLRDIVETFLARVRAA